MRTLLFIANLLLLCSCNQNPLGLDFLELEVPVADDTVFTVNLLESGGVPE